MSDTYTVLNPGVGGDVMDESANPVTGYKRPRVVVGGDGGELAAVTNAAPVDNDYALVTRSLPVKTATGAVDSVSGVITNATLAISNTARYGLTIYNDSTANLYIKLGATASTSDFTLKMEPYSYYELPYLYTGQIDGIWDGAGGNARVTELTV